jgi:dnaJ domain protein
MKVTQTLESLSILTDNDALFRELRDMINKNFTKILSNKNKIISFYEESEIPQRKCFLKFIKKLYEKQSDDKLDIRFANYKTIKLGFVQKNTLTPVISLNVNFVKNEVKFELKDTLCRDFASYISESLVKSNVTFSKNDDFLNITISNDNDINTLNKLLYKRSYPKFSVNFIYDEKDYKAFKQGIKIKSSSKFVSRFSVLANLLEENFEILGCKKDDDFETIRQSYLSLANIYHPDRHANKNLLIQEEYAKKFKNIQSAYESLKPYFKNQENFVMVG